MTNSDKEILQAAIASGDMNYTFEEYENTYNYIDGCKLEGDMAIMAEELYILGIIERHKGLAGAGDPRYLLNDATVNEVQLLYRTLLLEQDLADLRRRNETKKNYLTERVAMLEMMRGKLVRHAVAV